jgi:F-type H+-transporting ATPase subunit epsilon
MQIMNVSIISPEEEIYNGSAEMVVVPGEDGDFAAMYDHAPLITYLRPGKLEIIEEEQKNKLAFFVKGGFVKVKDNQCIVMVDYIKNIKDIDVSANENEIGSLRSKLVSENNEGIKEGISENIELLETELSCLKDN